MSSITIDLDALQARCNEVASIASAIRTELKHARLRIVHANSSGEYAEALAAAYKHKRDLDDAMSLLSNLERSW